MQKRRGRRNRHPTTSGGHTAMTAPTPPTRHSAPFWIVTALNAVGVATLLLVVTGRVFDLHGALFEAGAPLGLIALFFLIPLGWVAIWVLHRRQGGSASAPHRYLLASNLFLGAMWVLSCFVVGMYVLVSVSGTLEAVPPPAP